MSFEAKYVFKASGKEVVIQHKGGGDFNKFLRVKPGALDEACPEGGKGALARWEVELIDGGNKIKLKSKKTGKYLRIKPNATGGATDKIDAAGAGGKWTVFNVKKTGEPNEVKLESAEQAGKYIAVQKDGVLKIGGGGPWTVLRFFREGGGGGGGAAGGAFTKNYVFKASGKEVVIQHKGGGDFNKFLRVKPGAEDQADSQGGKGQLARFEVELIDGGSKCKLKSKKTGKYLRIKPNAQGKDEDKIDIAGGGGKWTVFKVINAGAPNEVKLESAEQPGRYVAVQKDNVIRVGGGGPWTVLRFFRDN